MVVKRKATGATPNPAVNRSAEELARVFRPKAAADFMSVSRTTLWRLARDGVLPPPLHISARARGWRLADLLAAQAAMQPGGGAGGGK